MLWNVESFLKIPECRPWVNRCGESPSDFFVVECKWSATGSRQSEHHYWSLPQKVPVENLCHKTEEHSIRVSLQTNHSCSPLPGKFISIKVFQQLSFIINSVHYKVHGFLKLKTRTDSLKVTVTLLTGSDMQFVASSSNKNNKLWAQKYFRSRLTCDLNINWDAKWKISNFFSSKKWTWLSQS